MSENGDVRQSFFDDDLEDVADVIQDEAVTGEEAEADEIASDLLGEEPSESAAVSASDEETSEGAEASADKGKKKPKTKRPAKTPEEKAAEKQQKEAEKKERRQKRAERRKERVEKIKEEEEALARDDRELEETPEKRKRVLIFVAVVLVVLAIGIFLFSDRFYNMLRGESSYILTDSGISVSYTEGNTTMLIHDGRLLRCSQDGLQALNERGSVIYDIPFTMSSPYMVNAGEYVSVADRLGMELIVVKGGQTQVQIKTESNILLNTVNEAGQAAVVLDAAEGHIVNLYSASGETLLQRRTYATSDGIPIALALDKTGSRLATVYVNYTGTALQSIITVFDLTETGSALVDRIVGSAIYNDCVISDIRFVGDLLFFAGTNRMGELTTRTAVNVEWEKTLNYEIDSLALSDDFFAIRYGDGLAGTAEAAANNIVVYSYNGEILSQANIENVDYLDVWGDTVIYASGRSYTGVSSTGKPRWTLNSGDNFSRLIAFDSGRTVACTQSGVIRFFKVTLRTAEGEGYDD